MADAPITLSQFARLVDVTAQAVSKAHIAGRLSQSVTRDRNGRPVIIDVDLALAEWNGDLGQTTTIAAPRAGGFSLDMSYADTQREIAIERARKLRLENDARDGSLIDAATAARAAFEFARTLRESCLNIPARVAAAVAAETDASKVFQLLDGAIREALTTTADKLATHDATEGAKGL